MEREQCYVEMFYSAFDFLISISTHGMLVVLLMTGMFYNAVSFNQSIGSWPINNVKICQPC